MALLHRIGVIVLGAALASCGSSVKASVNVSDGDRASSESTPKTDEASAPREGPAPRREIAITQKPLTAGLSWTMRMNSGRYLIVNADAGGSLITVDEVAHTHLEVRQEVLTVDGDRITKTKLTFVSVASDSFLNGHAHRPKSPLAGKSYVLERRPDGVLVITTDRGAKVSKREGDALAGFGPSVEPDPKAPGKPLHVGDTAEWLAAPLRRGLAQNGIAGDVSLELLGTRDVGGVTCGVFHLRLDMQAEASGVVSHSALDGEMLVRTTDGMPVSMTAKGPVTAAGTVHQMRAEVDGTSTIAITWTTP